MSDLYACEWCGEQTDHSGQDNACMIFHCLDCIGRCWKCQDDLKDQGDL